MKTTIKLLMLILLISSCSVTNQTKRKNNSAKNIEKWITDNSDQYEKLAKAQKRLDSLKELQYNLRYGISPEEQTAESTDSDQKEEPTPSETKKEKDPKVEETEVEDTDGTKTEGEEPSDTSIGKEPKEEEVKKPEEEATKPEGETEETEKEKELSELQEKLKAIEDKIEREKIPKFSLSPDSSFQNFALGANFDLLDGLSTSSLYADLLFNFRASKKKFGFGSRLSFQLGTTRGRNTSLPNDGLEGTSTDQRAIREAVFNPQDSTVFPRWIVYDIERDSSINTSADLTTVYGRINYRLLGNQTKLYFTSQIEYGTFSRNRTVVTTTSVDTVLSALDARDIPIIQNPLPPVDTVRLRQVSSYFLPGFGFTIFNGSDDFDLSLTLLGGPRIPLRDDDRLDGMVLLTQATILDKKVIGAKLGFEMRYYYHDSVQEPSYFFFIAKQFSLQEFFKVFSPTGGG